MKRPFRRRPRTEFVDDPRTGAERVRDEAFVSAHGRPVDPSLRERSLRHARAVWRKKQKAYGELAALGEIDFDITLEHRREGVVARALLLGLETEPMPGERTALSEIVATIKEEMRYDPVGVLETLMTKRRSRPVRVTAESQSAN